MGFVGSICDALTIKQKKHKKEDWFSSKTLNK